jgi:hypothetical protein
MAYSGIESLCGKFVEGDVKDMDFPEMKIDRNQINRYLLRTGISSLPVRLAMGLFYTQDEWEQKRKEILSKPLPSLPETAWEKFCYSIKRFLKGY